MGVDVKDTALARVTPPETVASHSVVSQGLEAAFLAFLQAKSATGLSAPATVAIDRRLFLNVAEAAEFSGLPAVFLRRLIAADKLKALKTGAGWRIPRAALEQLSTTLTDAAAGPRQLSEHELRDMELNRLRRKGIIADPAAIPEPPAGSGIV